MTETEVAKKDIIAIASRSTKTLATALKKAELEKTLQSNGPFTVFAPTDAAFASVQKEIDLLLKSESKDELSKVLTGHVVRGKLLTTDLVDGNELTTLSGSKIKVHVKDGNISIGEAKVNSPDVMASNGVIHIIDKVLLIKE